MAPFCTLLDDLNHTMTATSISILAFKKKRRKLVVDDVRRTNFQTTLRHLSEKVALCFIDDITIITFVFLS